MLRRDFLNNLNSLSFKKLVEAGKYLNGGTLGFDFAIPKKDLQQRVACIAIDKLPPGDGEAVQALWNALASAIHISGKYLPNPPTGEPESVPAESDETKDSDDAAKAIAAILAKASKPGMDESKVRALVKSEISLTVLSVAKEAAEKAARECIPTRVDLYVNGERREIEGIQHKTFPKLLQFLSAGVNVYLVGPAGSGKTMAVEQAAQALGRKFYFNGAIDTEYKLLGFTDAMGRVVNPQFRQAYENGGLYLFDEIDGSGPSALLAVNAALANGYCDFPDGMVKKHPDFICVAAANTWGLGATSDYVGRAKLDAASLDRFVFLSWDYDEKLELHLAGNPDWTVYVQTVRARARHKGVKVVISPRASIYGAKLLAAGVSRDDAIESCLKKGMTAEQWNSIKGDM